MKVNLIELRTFAFVKLLQNLTEYFLNFFLQKSTETFKYLNYFPKRMAIILSLNKFVKFLIKFLHFRNNNDDSNI